MMIYDISPPISESLAVWPGDTPPTREIRTQISAGDHSTSSTLRTTVHLGAHADAPSHISLEGPSIDRCALDPFLGECQVITVAAPSRARITAEMLEDSVRAPRILLATGTYPDPTHFNEDFAGLSPELIDYLADNRVRLVGIDTPSVDPYESEELPAHHAALQHNMAALEGLVLEHVPAGIYELVALPLRLVGFDGSPVRAVLRTFGPTE
jgi:arylformamidase